jgi:hypothetical protein
MKVAVFFVVLALLVPFCLGYCDPAKKPTSDAPDPNGFVPCTNLLNGQTYYCPASDTCDDLGGCLTCLTRSDGFTFISSDGTECCNQSKITPGKIRGDPHFSGFDGSYFDFMGLANEWFSLLSTEYIQLNGYFQPSCGFYKGTYVTEIGLLVNGSRIHLTTDSSTINGDELTCCKDLTPIPLNGGALRHQWANHFEVETGELLVKLTRLSRSIEKDCLKASFNLDFTLKEYIGMIHGVIGQTAHHPLIGNAPEVEGKTEDYVVSGPFATDSKFNRYNL